MSIRELLNYLKNKYPKKNISLMYNPSRNKIKSKSRQFNENGIINIVYAGNLGLAQNSRYYFRLLFKFEISKL